MAWQARNSDNTARTPSPYVRHNSANEVVAGGLLGQNDYERYDESNVVEDPQPTSATQTDAYGNQFKNWDGDYVAHDTDNNPA